MTIKYKFNKSSEARDCVVESVKLETTREIDLSFNNKDINEEELIRLLNSNNHSEFAEIDDVISSLYYNRDYDFYNDNIEDSEEVYICSYIDRKVTGRYSYGNHETIKVSFWFKDFTIKFTVYIIEGGGEWVFSRNDNELKYTIKQEFENLEIKETKQFTSQQQLKDYINTIQEPIEFIAESSIDDILMKEWIGEWETSYNCDECNNRNLGYWNDCDYNLCCKKEVKTGSPKLNSNWTFKIE